MYGISIGRLLIASVIAGIIGLGSVIAIPSNTTVTNMHLVTSAESITVDETFSTSIVVHATEPVNVFEGLLTFDSEQLKIESIDYNISIADLWAELPWYSNGEGTLGFTGGTTKPGGFTGTDTLITVTFKALKAGEARIKMEDVHVLKHDGLGTEAITEKTLDAVLDIKEEIIEIPIKKMPAPAEVHVISETKSTDLNNDGKQNIADVSVFMADLAKHNLRSDFNEDGRVNLKDLSILMDAK